MLPFKGATDLLACPRDTVLRLCLVGMPIVSDASSVGHVADVASVGNETDDGQYNFSATMIFFWSILTGMHIIVSWIRCNAGRATNLEIVF